MVQPLVVAAFRESVLDLFVRQFWHGMLVLGGLLQFSMPRVVSGYTLCGFNLVEKMV